MIKWLQNWYKNNCDGSWEHKHLIRINSIDNPGWNVEIDFFDLKYSIQNLEWRLVEVTENNWIGYKVTNGVFNAAGDPDKLNFLIYLFRLLVENGNINDDSILNKLRTEF